MWLSVAWGRTSRIYFIRRGGSVRITWEIAALSSTWGRAPFEDSDKSFVSNLNYRRRHRVFEHYWPSGQ